jgi:glycosyl transferase family 25
MTGQIPVFLINLDRSPHRLRNMHRLLSELGVTYERVSAVDGVSLQQSDIAREIKRLDVHNPLSAGEVGCFLSHRRLLQRIVNNHIERALILEDDVGLDADLPRWLGAHDALLMRFPILKLETWCQKKSLPGTRVARLHGRDLVFIPKKGLPGTAGYTVTRDGAIALLSRLDALRKPLDHQMFDYSDGGPHAVHVMPLLCWQEGQSEIERAKDGYAPPSTSIATRAIRIAYRARRYGVAGLPLREFPVRTGG